MHFRISVNEGFVSGHKFWVRRSNLSFLQVAGSEVEEEEEEEEGETDRKRGSFLVTVTDIGFWD